MTTPHVIASSSGAHHSSTAATNGIVGSNFRVGKKIGEGSFGVVYEGMWALLSWFIRRFVVTAEGGEDSSEVHSVMGSFRTCYKAC